MHTIIGAGGAIGKPLAREIGKLSSSIRLVGRQPQAVNANDELYPLDASHFAGLDAAIAGSEVVYVVIGFTYTTKVWQQTWPPFMKSVIEACEKYGSKLVFFDNVYSYAASAIPHMTEGSPLAPPSRKGQVRLQLHQMIMEAVEKGRLQALIARAADFYGPDNKASALQLMVAENLIKGKKAQAFGDVDRIHSYTYTPDAAWGTAALAQQSDTWNQVWHLPTSAQILTNRQWIEKVAAALNKEPRVQTIPLWMLKLLGWFIPIMREFPEMMYQYNQDYFFDSSKFTQRFGNRVTDPDTGIAAMTAQLMETQTR